jgi:hypothetical protein
MTLVHPQDMTALLSTAMKARPDVYTFTSGRLAVNPQTQSRIETMPHEQQTALITPEYRRYALFVLSCLHF